MENLFTSLLKDLLTQKELKVLQKRFQIMQLLKTNLTYRQIARRMGISTTTVVRLNQRLGIRTDKKRATLRSQNLTENTKMPLRGRRLPWKIG